MIDERGGKEILVRDIFTHEEKVISVALIENPATIGDMKVTRLVPVAGVYEYFFGSFYLPLEFKDVMVRLLERFKEEHNKTWQKFLKENGDLLIQLVAETFSEEEETDQVPENPGGDFEIPDFMPEDMEVVESILELDWKKDIYRQEAKLFVEKTRGTYLPEDIISGLYMWWDYTSLETPNFRKSGVWAAALNDFIDELYEYYHYGSRSEIANVYGISLSSLSTNYRRLVDFFQGLQPDKRGFREDQVPENLPKKKITPDVEQSIQKLKGILESGGRKASLEDLEDDPTGDGMPSGKTNAQDLIYDAWEAGSPKQKIRLAKKALEIDPASADAYVLLAQYQATSPEEVMTYYRKGIEAGEKALGKAFFKENEGDFWGILETRPYMRAKMGLGQMLLENKAYAEAAEVFEDMLRLNPNDNQGARSLLVLAYFMEKDYAKAKALLDDYDEDFLSDWSYNKALQVFAEEGESKEAKRRLKNAVKKNPHVPKYLLGEKPLPENLPDAYSLGGEEEAVIYAIHGKKAWSKTPGALAWLYNSIRK